MSRKDAKIAKKTCVSSGEFFRQVRVGGVRRKSFVRCVRVVSLRLCVFARENLFPPSQTPLAVPGIRKGIRNAD